MPAFFVVNNLIVIALFLYKNCCFNGKINEVINMEIL